MQRILGLVLLFTPLTGVDAQSDPGSPMAELRQLEREYAEVHREFLKKIRKLESVAEREALWDARPTKAEDWTPRFWKLARAHPRTAVEFRALNWIRTHSATKEEHAGAVARLLEHHIDHRDIGSICRRYIGAPHPTTDPGNIAIIRRVIAESPHARARAEAGYCLAKVLQHLDARANRREIVALLERAAADAKDVDGVFPFRDLKLSEVAKLDLFELRNLQPGCTAPEIAAEDLEGNEFRLSDYRGKVVLLDFWGHW